jgi:hypothetical protein
MATSAEDKIVNTDTSLVLFMSHLLNRSFVYFSFNIMYNVRIELNPIGPTKNKIL